MESGEPMHDNSHVQDVAETPLNKDSPVNAPAEDTALDEKGVNGSLRSVNISGCKQKDASDVLDAMTCSVAVGAPIQLDPLKDIVSNGTLAAQQAIVGSASSVVISDNVEKNQSTPDPIIGMPFETEQAAYDCYSEYGKRNGFRVRWDNRTLSKRTGVTLARRFVCCKQGYRGDGQRKRHSLAKYHREETRCGCLAYMKIKLATDGKYRVIELNTNHNHSLACQVPVNYSLANLVVYNHPLVNQLPNIRPVPVQVANIHSLPTQVPNVRPPIQVPNIRPLPNQVPSVCPLPNQVSSIHQLPNQVHYHHPLAVFVPVNPQTPGHTLGNNIAPSPVLANPHVVIMQRFPGAQAAVARKLKKRKRKSAGDAVGPIPADSAFQDRETQASGPENLGSLPPDVQNCLPVKRTNAMQKFDIDGSFEYFKSKQAKNTSFFYSFQLDIDEKITNVFWMDGRMQTDYVRFGDVLCIDTTYKTNDYGRPLILFTGINHHKQIVIFGAALLYDESAYSFKWMFKTFLEAVGGKKPNTVLTDESNTLTNAVESEFPGIQHRLCVWHLYQNASKKLAKVFTGSKDFDDDFSRCIYDYEVEAEFLEGWNAMVEKYGLEENTWLQQKFKEREKWAPVYGRNAFCADLKSAQHKERFNKELKRHLSSTRDIETFLQNFDKVLEDKRQKELEANSKMTKSSPYAPPVSIIQHAARVYTSAVFDMFMTEYVSGLECLVKDKQYDGHVQIMTVEDGQCHDHTVRIHYDKEIISCSCCKFENVGILCGHVLTCITKKMRSIPERYILKRWTRCAGSLPLPDRANAMRGDTRCVLSERYNSLVHDFIQLSVRAAEDEDIYNCAMKHKAAMCEEMEKVFKDKTSSLSYHLFGEHVW